MSKAVAQILGSLRMNNWKNPFILRRLDTVHRFSTTVYKGDNIGDFQFAFLYTPRHFLKGFTLKGITSSQGEQFFPFGVDPFWKGKQNNFDSYLS